MEHGRRLASADFCSRGRVGGLQLLLADEPTGDLDLLTHDEALAHRCFVRWVSRRLAYE